MGCRWLQEGAVGVEVVEVGQGVAERGHGYIANKSNWLSEWKIHTENHNEKRTQF